LNQPLTGIRGFAQEISVHLKKYQQLDRETLQFYTAEVIKNVDRMTHIIRHLRNFARQGDSDIQACPPAELISNTMLLFKKQLENHGIEVETTVADNLAPMACHPFEMEQVLINLLANARDAIVESGRQNGKIKLHVEANSGNVNITVSDNGCGIEESVLPRIFDPFFTTKEVGKGMGLGLSISFSIVHRFHGSIRVQSKKGHGTTFVISIPIFKSSAGREAA
jgi:two-component system C4-dicarboxylate transport sensor histidine kinase DctB